jgi:predicted permease
MTISMKKLLSTLEQRIKELVAAGMSVKEARAAARREFGNVGLVKETAREVWGWRWLEDLFSDMRFGARMLRKSPGFTTAAVVTLTLGIGVNTSVFSFLNAVVLRPLAIPRANQVVVVHRGDSTRFSYADYADYRDGNHALAALAATFPTEANLGFNGQSELITCEAVSANYDDVMRIPLLLGHWFTDEDGPLAVISYRAWVSQFHADPDVLGRQVRSLSAWYTVVGVAARDFTGVFAPRPTDLWVPLRFWAKQFPGIEEELRDPTSRNVMIFGRLREGVTSRQAAANLNGIDTQIRTQASENRTTRLAVSSVRGVSDIAMRAQLLPVVALFAAVTGFVLLIACVNIGNLLLARGSVRQREIAMRLALGASRARVARQLMTETFLVALMGGAGGLVLGAWTNRLLEGLRPAMPIPVSLRLSMDARIVGFALAVSLVTMLLFGLLPAWRSTRSDVYLTLKGDAVPLRHFRLRRASLVAQMALSLLLLLCAGLFLKSILRIRDVNPGFAVQNRLYAWTYISPPEFTPQTGRQFYADAVQRLRSLPGVRNAGLTHFLPLRLDEGSDCVSGDGRPPLDAAHGTIGPGYLEVMNIPLLEGRDFSVADAPNGPAVVIINQTLAHRLWPHRNAVRRRIFVGCEKPEAAEVVGVARNSKGLSLGEGPRPYFYRLFSQNYTGLATIVVHTDGNPLSMAETIRRSLLEGSKGVEIYALDTMAHHVEQSYWQTRWIASLLAIFGALALALAAVGLYGVIAYWVTQQTHEMGVRMALGAQKVDVLAMVIKKGFRLTLAGVAFGIVGALALTRFLASLLYGVKPTDPLTFVAASLILVSVALLACYIPARRATKVDPIVALRYE